MDIETLRVEYRSVESNARSFANELSRQIDELLDQKNISLAVPIQSRVKDWASLSEKIERKSLVLDSVKSLDDLIGLRLILLFQRDVETIDEVVSSNFEVLSKENTSDRLGESQFGYGSVHFIVTLPEEWLAVPTLSMLSGLKAEVQVRTTAQHLWAAASHALQYKQEAGVPLPVRRAIHRASALLETVDLEFERVLQQRSNYKQSSEIESPSAILNVDSLAVLLDVSLPDDNKGGNENYADLLEDLLRFSIDTPAKLADLIKRHKADALRNDKTAMRSAKKDGNYEGTTKERSDKGVFYTHVGLARELLAVEFGSK